MIAKVSERIHLINEDLSRVIAENKQINIEQYSEKNEQITCLQTQINEIGTWRNGPVLSKFLEFDNFLGTFKTKFDDMYGRMMLVERLKLDKHLFHDRDQKLTTELADFDAKLDKQRDD